MKTTSKKVNGLTYNQLREFRYLLGKYYSSHSNRSHIKDSVLALESSLWSDLLECMF